VRQNRISNHNYFIVMLLAIFLVIDPNKLMADGQPVKMVPVLKINKELDRRTEVSASRIPHAGNGLFAAVAVTKGEVIGELGGRLLTAEEYAPDNHYLASIPECAWEETKPYKFLDSKDFGGHVSRINFAPSKINGVETHFQNAAIHQLCEYPYFIFVAVSDIEPGTEIWASYGPYYDYDRFMYLPEVREFFCTLANLDCREQYVYEH